MQDDLPTSPAAGAIETPPADHAITPGEQTDATPATPTPTAPARQDYDLDALLADEDFARKLRSHPKIKQDIDGLVGARLQREREVLRQQQDAERQQQEIARERQRLAQQKEMDEYELGAAIKAQLPEQEARLAEQERQRAALERQADINTHALSGLMMLLGEGVNSLRTAGELDAEEWESLQPNRFRDPQSYREAIFHAVAEKRAIKRARELAKPEADAMVQERLGQQRDQSARVPTLPQGAAAQGDKDFLAEYAKGNTNDHGRARRILAAL